MSICVEDFAGLRHEIAYGRWQDSRVRNWREWGLTAKTQTTENTPSTATADAPAISAEPPAILATLIWPGKRMLSLYRARQIRVNKSFLRAQRIREHAIRLGAYQYRVCECLPEAYRPTLLERLLLHPEERFIPQAKAPEHRRRKTRQLACKAVSRRHGKTKRGMARELGIRSTARKPRAEFVSQPI